MSTDNKNQKFCRVPLDRDTEFQKSIPAEGSVYFRPATTSVVVGDGVTPGGIEFVSRAWVLQKIEEANWKAKAEKDIFLINSNISIANTAISKINSINLLNLDLLVQSTCSGSI